MSPEHFPFKWVCRYHLICAIRLLDNHRVYSNFCLGQNKEKQDISPVIFLSFKYFPGFYCCWCCDLMLTLSHCNCSTVGFFFLWSVPHSHPHGDLGFLCQVSLGDSVWPCVSMCIGVPILLRVTSLASLTTVGARSLPTSLQFKLPGCDPFIHSLDVCNRSVYMYSSYLVSHQKLCW